MANEKRLIDADALKANFVVIGEFAKDLWHSATVRAAIDNAPTVDAVEVVRCKDCEHYTKSEENSGGHCCEHCMWTNTDDFCSYGERS